MFHPSSPKCLRSPSTALTLPSLPPLAISPFPPPHLPSHLLITALSSPMLVQIRVDVSLAAEGIPPRVWAPTSPPRNVALPARPKTECALRRSSVALHERAANECCQRACPRSEVPHLNKPIALQKLDLLRCVPRPTRASWRCSPWVYPMARRLAGDTHVLRAHPWSGAEKTMHTRCFIHALCDL